MIYGAPDSLQLEEYDAVTASVAAASIVAKVVRDRIMDRYHRRFPEFGFDRHRGYGTAEHLAVLGRLGPSPIHRLSFKGVGQPRLWEAEGGPVVMADDGGREDA